MTDVKSLEGQKCTMVLINTIGAPVVRLIKVQKAEIVKAQKYQNHMTDKMCLKIQYVEKGKRKPVAYKYTEADLAIGLGWQDIKTPGSFTSFDSSLFEKISSELENVVYKQTGM